MNAPEILFVCSASRAKKSISTDSPIPSSFELPNLIVVGSVDQAGAHTPFTSYSNRIDVYAKGVDVYTAMPGGSKMMMSDNTLAAPQVSNLAAKLLAINPELAPADIIELILGNADAVEMDGEKTIRLMNGKATVEKLKK